LELLLIFPYNGNAIEALDCLGDEFRCMAFIDDTSDKHGTDRHGNLVMGREALVHWPDAKVLAVPGSPASYLHRADAIRSLGVPVERFAQVIHSTARISPLATIGRNVLIMAGVVVTSNATVEDNTCILPNTVVHHDVVIGEFSLIGSNVTLAGGVRVGPNCYIGSGSAVMNGVQIGERALIGLGSNVIRDVAADRTVAGNPARELRAGG
jgi:sugar O-acyltransferase (sialic acid O-acetyltransferase NeuD family)